MSQYVKQVEVESLKVGPNLQFTQLLQLDVQTSVQVGLLRTDRKLALYGTDGRLFTTDVSAKFKYTRQKLGQVLSKIQPDQI